RQSVDPADVKQGPVFAGLIDSHNEGFCATFPHCPMPMSREVKKLFTAKGLSVSVETVVSRETRRRHPSCRAARNAPGNEVGLGPGTAAVAAHRPAQPLCKDEACRIGEAAVAVSLQHHALAARHDRHFIYREDDKLAVL